MTKIQTINRSDNLALPLNIQYVTGNTVSTAPVKPVGLQTMSNL